MSKEAMTKTAQKVINALKKYKYAVLVLLIGVALLLIPFGGKDEEPATPIEAPTQTDDTEYTQALEERLTQMLSQMQGAGRVSVMLTMETGTRTEYQTDTQFSTDTSETATQTNEERKTVILSEGSAYDEAAVAAVVYPRFQGALIMSEGADNTAVKWDLIQAVSALTGLSTDKIKVVKMK